jgi:DNA-binding NarL/FixJ family response regulator
MCTAPTKRHNSQGLSARSSQGQLSTRESTMNKQERDTIMPIGKRKRPEALTNREHQILQLIWSGLTNKEIAMRLKISVKTVEAHRATMMKKVRVSNTAQLLKAAIQEGVIQI